MLNKNAFQLIWLGTEKKKWIRNTSEIINLLLDKNRIASDTV